MFPVGKYTVHWSSGYNSSIWITFSLRREFPSQWKFVPTWPFTAQRPPWKKSCLVNSWLKMSFMWIFQIHVGNPKKTTVEIIIENLFLGYACKVQPLLEWSSKTPEYHLTSATKTTIDTMQLLWVYSLYLAKSYYFTKIRFHKQTAWCPFCGVRLCEVANNLTSDPTWFTGI